MFGWIIIGLGVGYFFYGLVVESRFARVFPEGLDDGDQPRDYLRPQELEDADEATLIPRVSAAFAADTLRLPEGAGRDDAMFHEPHWGHTSGMLRGTLKIDGIGYLPEPLSAGLFEREGTYPVVARCGIAHDPTLKFTVHRLAVKLDYPDKVPNVSAEDGLAHELDLLFVEGEPEVNGEGHAFFTRNGRQLDLATSVKPPSMRTLRALGNWRNIRILLWVLANVKRLMAPLRREPSTARGWAARHYFSLGPFALGDGMMKLSLEPMQSHDVDPVDPMSDDFAALSRTRMEDWLARGEDAKFTLGIQIATEGCIPEPGRDDPPKAMMATEYCDLQWDERRSPYLPIGTLTLHADDAINSDEIAGALQFNAWNTLPEMRPLGQVFRLRKSVHKAHSDVRVAHLYGGTPGAMTGKCPFA